MWGTRELKKWCIDENWGNWWMNVAVIDMVKNVADDTPRKRLMFYEIVWEYLDEVIESLTHEENVVGEYCAVCVRAKLTIIWRKRECCAGKGGRVAVRGFLNELLPVSLFGTFICTLGFNIEYQKSKGIKSSIARRVKYELVSKQIDKPLEDHWY